MVRWEGVEPPTLWFVARCSIQLSYQRAAGAQYSENIAGSPEVVEKPSKNLTSRQLIWRIVQKIVRKMRFMR
jgi:hypothetical protein